MTIFALLLFLAAVLWPWQPAPPDPPTTRPNLSSRGGAYEAYARINPVVDLPSPAVLPGPDRPAMVELPSTPTPRPAPTATPAAKTMRVWVTFYSAHPGAVVASELEGGFRPGIAAAYAVRHVASGRIVSTRIQDATLAFGTSVHVSGLGRFELWDTGAGFVDGRPWLDIGVSSHEEAVRLGAGWRTVRVIEEGAG